MDPVDRVEFLQPDMWWRLTAQGILLLTTIMTTTTMIIMLLLLKVRECAIGRSYDDCEGDAREERTCNADQVTVVMVMVMVIVMAMENISRYFPLSARHGLPGRHGVNVQFRVEGVSDLICLPMMHKETLGRR